MAVPKITQTRYMDESVQATQDYTSNPIPTSLSFLIFVICTNSNLAM